MHIPWCVRKCPYCDFNSHALQQELPEKTYLNALLQDFEQDLPTLSGRRLETIFIGGGTPSLFSPEIIHQLLTGIRQQAKLTPNAEITLEANPGTIERGLFSEFHAAGITRLSIGVQSFEDAKLQHLGRIHSGREAWLAVEQAHQAGFDNFNIDLMFGLPDQSTKQARLDIRTAIELCPSHISYYQLTLEPNTAFHHHPPLLPPDDTLWDMQCQGQAQLEAEKYQQYEVSAFSQKQQVCHHNLNYWTFGDYIGIGAGAHGKISEPNWKSIFRTHKHRHPQAYLKAANKRQSTLLAGSHTLLAKERPLEFMMNALRLTNGFDQKLFSKRTGLPFCTLTPMLEEAISKKLLVLDREKICATAQGKRYLNDLLILFF